MVWISVASIVLSLIAIGINVEMRIKEKRIQKRIRELESR